MATFIYIVIMTSVTEMLGGSGAYALRENLK